MITLVVAFGPSHAQWDFAFKTPDKAKHALESLHQTAPTFITITDDYGQTATINTGVVHGALIQDASLRIEVDVERAVAQARGQAKAQQRAAEDPVLRFAAGNSAPRMMNSPAFRS